MGHDTVTIGELARRLDEMGERIEKKLDAIDTQVRITNGRTTKLEVLADGLRRDVDAKAAKPSPPPPPPVETGESLSVRISPKMWALIASIVGGLSIFAPIVSDWLEKLVNKLVQP